MLVLIGAALAAAGVATILGQSASGAQPWGVELSDNFIFVKTLPFTLGLGVVVGLLMARTYGPRRAADGAVRRFSPGSIFGHWVITLGFLLALPTGVWQYLGGILDVNAPLPLYLFYRVHYIGGSIILFAVAAFLSYWWVTGDRSLLVPRGQWRRHLVGLAYELPPAIRTRYADLLKIDLRQRAPDTAPFTYYERVVSFPSWTFALALITVTGLIKAGRYLVPVPGLLLFFASTLHVAAMVLILIKVLDHLRYTLPRWSMMTAIVTGWLGEPMRTPSAGAERGSAPAGVLGRSDS
ncbi:MAG TPA: hypothetical protein VGQ86_12095 [Candidatus Limnocylindria bacterium]|nr:hypothetical protein [Candidatus Limnocylindria bacterium]